MAALAADNSASARAKRAQLEAELAEAQANLQETYYERSISDQQEALDKELEDFQNAKDEEMESLDEYLENTELVVSDSLATIQSNTDIVYQTLKDMGKEYGLSIAESLTSPWKDGESAIQSYSETFGLSMSSTVEELKEVAAEYKKIMTEIEKYGKEVIGQVNENIETYQGGNKEPKAPKQKEPEKTIKVGGKINAGSAKIYDYAGDKTGEKQYYSKDPIYKVLAVNGNWVQVRYHKLTKGITGWFKKSDVKAYAKGTTGVVEDQLALIDELGEELVLGAKNGRLAYLSKGSGVIPADLTSNLMEWGELDPSMMLDQNRPVINNSYVTNNNLELNMNFGEVVHIDTVTNDTIPNLTKAIDKQLDKYMRGLNAEIRKYAR